MSRHEKLICLAGLALALLVPAAHAATHPAKSMRIMVSYATGSGTDILRGKNRLAGGNIMFHYSLAVQLALKLAH